MSTKTPLRVMAIHGVNSRHTDRSWITAWRSALLQGIGRWNPDQAVEFEFISCDDLFEINEPDDTPLVSRLWTIFGADFPRWLERHRRQGKQLESAHSELRWTAANLGEWMSNESLRLEVRRRILTRIEAFRPDVLCAHSLGSLFAYDALARPAFSNAHPLVLVTFGSQIGNRCVQERLPGPGLTRLRVQHWYHLYNRHDDLLTAPVRLAADNFTQIDTPFALPGLADRAAASYLAHAAMSQNVWRVLLEPDRLERSHRIFRNSA